MLNKYIEELVKTSSVRKKLDTHLEELTKTAAAEVAQEEFLKNASAEELAKLAGVKLPEDACPECASKMEKLGSVFQCSCGMMKKAKSYSVFSAAWEAGKKQNRINAAAQAAAQKAEEKAEKAGKNPETAAHRAYSKVQHKVASVEKVASLSHFTKAMRLSGGDIDQALIRLEAEGYTKLAGGIMPALQGLGSAVKGSLGKILGQVSKAYTRGAAKGGGVLGGLKNVAVKNPGLTAGVAGTAGVGAGYMMGKQGAAQLLEIGDAAGRILAKTAETPGIDIDPEEVAEAIDEAKERENVSGRSRNWGIGGGALGGLAGGGLGYGAGALLSHNPWLRAAGTGLGALAGGAGGAMLGRHHGAEEAQADRLVSFLRGRRAFQTGAQEGMQQGYLQGLTSGQGGMGGEEGPGPQ